MQEAAKLLDTMTLPVPDAALEVRQDIGEFLNGDKSVNLVVGAAKNLVKIPVPERRGSILPDNLPGEWKHQKVSKHISLKGTSHAGEVDTVMNSSFALSMVRGSE